MSSCAAISSINASGCCLRNAGTNFHFWSLREESPPEFKEALAQFAPRIPAQYMT